MAKTKEKKNYELKTGDGKYTFRVLKSADGIAHSISGAYPIVCQTEKGVQRLTRKQTEKFCLEIAIERGWFPTDGNK